MAHIRASGRRSIAGTVGDRWRRANGGGYKNHSSLEAPLPSRRVTSGPCRRRNRRTKRFRRPGRGAGGPQGANRVVNGLDLGASGCATSAALALGVAVDPRFTGPVPWLVTEARQYQNLYLSDASASNMTIYVPQTQAGAPLINSESVAQTGTTTATLAAGIVPLGNDTTCTFQFVDNADFQASGYSNATSVACTPGDLGSGFTYQAPSADLSGLTTGTIYHFRWLRRAARAPVPALIKSSRRDRVRGRRSPAAQWMIRRCSPPTETSARSG